MLVTNAASLYDALRREARGKEPPVAIAVDEIKQSLVVTSWCVRWCPYNAMMADPLTKLLHQANLQPVLQVMKCGHYTLASELEDICYRG